MSNSTAALRMCHWHACSMTVRLASTMTMLNLSPNEKSTSTHSYGGYYVIATNLARPDNARTPSCPKDPKT